MGDTLDSGWLLDLVGTPYLAGGSDPATGFDCYGLVRYVIRCGTGVSLPVEPIGWRRYGKVLDFSWPVFRYDVLFFAVQNDLSMVDHVGVAIDGRDFLHADRKMGQVVCEPISKYAREGRIISIGRVNAI
jgi:cell wall-associated NlpC family hydrolase